MPSLSYINKEIIFIANKLFEIDLNNKAKSCRSCFRTLLKTYVCYLLCHYARPKMEFNALEISSLWINGRTIDLSTVKYQNCVHDIWIMSMKLISQLEFELICVDSNVILNCWIDWFQLIEKEFIIFFKLIMSV